MSITNLNKPTIDSTGWGANVNQNFTDIENFAKGTEAGDLFLLNEQGSTPSTPATGDWKLYFKSDGLYTLEDDGTEVGPLGAGGGTASLWINFNGTGTVSIRDDFNVSSITDNGTGDYTINFTNNLSNNDYAVMIMTNEYITGNRSSGGNVRGNDDSLMTTSSVRIDIGSKSNGVAYDHSVVMVAIFGGA